MIATRDLSHCNLSCDIFILRESSVKKKKRKVRTLVVATRELHDVVMDPQHVELAVVYTFRQSELVHMGSQHSNDTLASMEHAIKRRWTKREIYRCAKCGRAGSLPNWKLEPTTCTATRPFRVERKDHVLGSEQEGDTDHRHTVRRHLHRRNRRS